MNKLAAVVLVVLVSVLVGACYKHTYASGSGAPDGRLVYDRWHAHWLLGLIGDDTVQVQEWCPSGDATIHSEATFVNGLVTALIGVIYSPTTVTVRCSDGRDRQLAVSPEQQSEIVAHPLFLERVEALVPDRLDEARATLRGTKP